MYTLHKSNFWGKEGTRAEEGGGEGGGESKQNIAVKKSCKHLYFKYR